MLYPKNKDKKLSDSLFKNPTSEYRATPFWAWNCELNKELLAEQIAIFQEMGFGGFHMHPRTGMATEYLSDAFFDFVKFSVNEAERRGMLAWLYDEDRWPSGSAGGIVTKKITNRGKRLVLTATPIENAVSRADGEESGEPYLLAAYEIFLNADGTLKKYNKTNLDGKTHGKIRYAYVLTNESSPWFNNQAYVDTLSKEAMDQFIKVTYEGYKKAVGDRFGKSVPAIFTDEPQFNMRAPLPFSDSDCNAEIPWTTGFDVIYKDAVGEDILDTLPELFWELEGGKLSSTRYNFMDVIAERFAVCFMDNCGKWCSDNGLLMTGHMMLEPTLELQSWAISDVMRAYRSFTLPGIDVLCERMEFSTAKQAASAVHQYGREGMLSELYGVTNWDYDFRGHKFQGDWQAALGVTVRVPHLAWLSMRGEAKRDYPASISYQSPWYKEYSYIENHFARAATALTRGKPIVKIGVIHPIETFWLHTGPIDLTSEARRSLDEKFKNLIEWLLFSQLDFDFISESLLPTQCKVGGAPLKVGEMEYDAVIVPAQETLRTSTLIRLEEFQKQGGKLIFMGKCPALADGKYSDAARPLYERSVNIDYDKTQLLSALSDNRLLKITNSNGTHTDNLIYQMREDNGERWLFIAQGKKKWEFNAVQENVREQNDVVKPQNVKIVLNGKYVPTLYNTLTGEICEIDYRCLDSTTEITRTFYSNDSLLLKLTPTEDNCELKRKQRTAEVLEEIDFRGGVSYKLDEDNVYLLDRARFSFDGKEVEDEEEILRIDNRIRERLSWPPRQKKIAQPWAQGKEIPAHFVTLFFEIESETRADEVYLGIEGFSESEVFFNGERVCGEPCGFYVDKAIDKVRLPALKRGTNTLKVTLPYLKSASLEYLYLIGDFGVRLCGAEKTVTQKPKKIGFGSIVHQGFPFYSGNITYILNAELKERAALSVRTNVYRGAFVKVSVDGEKKNSAFSPYECDFGELEAGNHEIRLKLFGNRHNTFAPLHNSNPATYYFGPDSFRSSDDAFGYEYFTKDLGILKSPVLKLYKDMEKS
ncbi:MAG: hypothetical protein J6Q68_01100 [Clostridia bacterium]|nr:hypothetical protein [Clostridia bacterium]